MGKQWKQWETLFEGAIKSLQMAITAMKLKDTCSLEEKLWQTKTAYLKSSGDLRWYSGTPLQYSCLENPMDGGAWWAAVHGIAKSRTWLSDFTFTLHFHALEKEMATHSSVLTWRIPGTGEPGGLPSMGSHRVGHDLSDLATAGDSEGQGSLVCCSPWGCKESDTT